MMILLLSLLVIASTAEDQGWIPVKRDVYMKYHLETTPLEIKTNSELESNDRVTVFFSTSEGHYAGGLNLKFSSTVQYWIYDCSTSSTNLPVNLPAATDKIWRITLTRISGIKLVIHCNEVEVLNIVISNSVCGDMTWSTDWNREVEEVEFEVYDTASDYYRPRPEPCAAGTYRSADKTTCEQCAGNTISYEGASSCSLCNAGQVANPAKTECGTYVYNSTSTGSKDALPVAWSLAGCFLLTTVLVTIFAARKFLRRNCNCRNTAGDSEHEDADKQMTLISPKTSATTPDSECYNNELYEL